MIGTQFNQWEVVSSEGRGPFWTLWALKPQALLMLVTPALQRDPLIRNRLKKSWKVLCTLRHPGLVAAQEIIEQEGHFGLILEGEAGLQTLESHRFPMPISEVESLALQLGSALSTLHQAGLIHRDISPSTIVFGKTGPALLGAGVALAVQESGDGFIPGTPAYLAPELFAGKAASSAVDLYALGLVLHRALTPAQSFKAPEKTAGSSHVFVPEIPNISRLRVDTPAALAEVIASATRKDPAQRLSVEQFLSKLAPPEPLPSPPSDPLPLLSKPPAAPPAEPPTTSSPLLSKPADSAKPEPPRTAPVIRLQPPRPRPVEPAPTPPPSPPPRSPLAPLPVAPKSRGVGKTNLAFLVVSMLGAGISCLVGGFFVALPPSRSLSVPSPAPAPVEPVLIQETPAPELVTPTPAPTPVSQPAVQIEDTEAPPTPTPESTPEIPVAPVSTPTPRPTSSTPAPELLAIKISVRPKTETGVQVYLDGWQRGEAPLSLDVPPGRHELRWVKPGLVDRTCVIRVPEKGALTGYSFSLTLSDKTMTPPCP